MEEPCLDVSLNSREDLEILALGSSTRQGTTKRQKTTMQARILYQLPFLLSLVVPHEVGGSSSSATY